LFIGIFFFSVGYLSGIYKNGENLTLDNRNCEVVCENLKKDILESGVCDSISKDREIKSLVGDIISINNNKLIVKIDSIDLWTAKSLDRRTVLVDDITKIIRYIPKDKKKYQQELEEYYKTRDSYKTEDEFLLNKPSYQVLEELTLSDLHKGLNIIMRSETNIRFKDEFRALEIIIK